jgi:hypothetical protein
MPELEDLKGWQRRGLDAQKTVRARIKDELA